MASGLRRCHRNSTWLETVEYNCGLGHLALSGMLRLCCVHAQGEIITLDLNFGAATADQRGELTLGRDHAQAAPSIAGAGQCAPPRFPASPWHAPPC